MKGNNIKSFDWEACLSSSHNKEDLARELLSMFINELPVFREEIIKAYQQRDDKKLGNLLHKLNGACCYCGVPKLKMLIDQLEFILKTQPGINIQAYIDALNKEMENLIIILKKENFH